jgi:hypothetical protein
MRSSRWPDALALALALVSLSLPERAHAAPTSAEPSV